MEHEIDSSVIHSLSQLFNCMYYIDMKDKSFVDLGTKLLQVQSIIGSSGNAIEKFEVMFKIICKPEYEEDMRSFCDLCTLNERMRDRTWISKQFDGTINGWFEGFFIEGDRDEDGSLLHVIWCTKDANEHRSLLVKSNNDELTGLYNRRAYDEALNDFELNGIPKDFVYVAMDLNGLKGVNDKFGHGAGDELIRGAANCLRRVFGDYGKIYRIGGDEFVAMLNMDNDLLEEKKAQLEIMTGEWKGNCVDKLAISSGYVKVSEYSHELTVGKIAQLADDEMYEAKARFYRLAGRDRNGRGEAYRALDTRYEKVLKIDLKNDTYQIINMNDHEREYYDEMPDSLSEFIDKFVAKKIIHPEDEANFVLKTDLAYLRNHFDKEGGIFNLFYRRVIGDKYVPVLMEILKAEEYTIENQIFYLYVKRC